MANPPGVPSSDKKVYFDDEIFREIEDYTVKVEREEHVQVGDPILYVLASAVWCSEGTSSTGGAGAFNQWGSTCELRLPIHL